MNPNGRMMSHKIASFLSLSFLLVITGTLGNDWSVTYSKLNLCAVKGSTVFMNVTYTHPTDVKVRKKFWLINPVEGKEATDLCNVSGYSGRVEYLGDEKNHFSLRLSDVKKSDEHMYTFRIKIDKGGYQGHPGITLSVTEDLQLIAPAEVTEGESVILTCKTTCSLTDPTFIWYKNRHDLTTNTSKSNKLHLQVSSEDAGSYSCGVRGYEHLPSPDHNLIIRYAPKNVSVSISPSGEIVEGSSVTLTCSSDANPPVENYTWFKGTASVGKQKTFTISTISSDDSRQYKCMCSNKVGHQNSTSVSLNVLYPPKNISVSISPSNEIVEGSSVTLTCSSDANPPVEIYTWFKGSSLVKTGKNFTISNISSEDSGEYKCMCSNKFGHQNSTSVSLNVLYSPKNVSMSVSPSGEIVEGSSVTLTCISDANPPVEIYTWFKGASSVKTGQNLTISNISSEDSGKYKCMCSNEVGNQTSTSVSLNVLYPPKKVLVSISPSGEMVEGSSVNLTCSSDANPPVEIYTWFNETTSVGKGKTFIISNISSEDSGKYKCMCSNKVGNQNSTSVYLNVLYPPKKVLVSLSPSGVMVKNSSVTMNCSSDANPPVENYTWFKGTTSVSKGKTFTISNISSEDSGEYKCMCSNKVGHQNSTSVSLNVLYPPKNISISVSGEIVEGSSVNLNCSSDANPPVEIYTWFKENESSPVGSGQSYRALQSGQYYCKAQNKLGSERSSAVTITINNSVGVYAGIGAVVIVCICLIVVIILFKRKNKGIESTVDQSVKEDNLYENVKINDVNPAPDSTSANQNEDLYAKVVRHTKGAQSTVPDASASGEDEVQYASVRFIRSGADYRPSNAEDASVIYSKVK